ncbi:MAG: nicotinate-nicotinamide nucleotide adenylyltransferase [Candidatus Riflebacteria bacterium]|nr:nicotinate-nicotinamide nucleotide adenylyltransferase [Candidatus Riflebacteria bacterium]
MIQYRFRFSCLAAVLFCGWLAALPALAGPEGAMPGVALLGTAQPDPSAPDAAHPDTSPSGAGRTRAGHDRTVRRIGLYSGTFDPLHGGHLQVVDKAIALLDLDTVWLLPNAAPADKPDASAFDHRYAMARLAALRHPALRLPEPELIASFHAKAPTTYVADLMREIMRREGLQHTFFQICGTDSFLKMVEKGFLPRPGERRIVAVMARKGYETTIPAAARPLVERGCIRFFDPDVPELSSTRLRAIFQAGETPSRSELPSFLLRYIQRHLLYGAARPAVRPPAGYRAVRGRFPLPDRDPFLPVSLDERFPPRVLTDPLTLDIDAYLADKIPEEIQDLILTRGLRVIVLGGLLDDALGYLGRHGFTNGTVFVPAAPERIDLCYALATRDRIPHLVVTNVFGEDRLTHTALQYAQLLARNLLPASHLQVLAVAGYDRLDDRLCTDALRRLRADARTLVMFGYRGALNNVVSDLLKFLEAKGFAAYAGVTQAQLDAFRRDIGDSHLLQGSPAGSANFPYWEYAIPDSEGRLFRLVAFRNLYGDQTATVLRELIGKGFRQFVMFGNAGGLGRADIGEVLAPVVVMGEGQARPLRNAAAADYRGATSVAVPSVLVETQDWLARQIGATVVEVENAQAAGVLRENPGVVFYSGVLVSDRPGGVDITRRSEDSEEFLAAKRAFFFRLLRRIIRGEPGPFPRLRAATPPACP